jgi:hypothetical protein
MKISQVRWNEHYGECGLYVTYGEDRPTISTPRRQLSDGPSSLQYPESAPKSRHFAELASLHAGSISRFLHTLVLQ